MTEPSAPYFDEPLRESLRQPFRMQRVFARSFSAFGRSFFPFLMLGIIVYSPLIVYTLIITTGDDAAFVAGAQHWETVLAIGQFFLSLILSGAVIYGTFRQLRGEPTSTGKSIAVGLARLFPVIGVGLVAGLVIGLGIVALVVPGVIAYCMLWVAVPVAVVERPGVMPSLRRSRELTRGDRVPIFGIIFILGLAGGLSNYLLKEMLMNNPTLANIKAYMLGAVALSIVFGLFGAVVNAVGYHDLRAAKETVDLDELTSIFG